MQPMSPTTNDNQVRKPWADGFNKARKVRKILQLALLLDHRLKHSFANDLSLLASARRMRRHVYPNL